DNDGDGFSECAGDCNDANAAIHPGAAEVCDGVDNDCDGIVDGQAAAPGQVPGLRLTVPPYMVQWDASAPAYDLLRGVLSQLPVGHGPSETCLAPGTTATSVPDATLPALGTGLWYAVRGRNACGAGSYGVQSNGSPEISATCP